MPPTSSIMGMDPITRREAQKIEQVLLDLVRDLELVSYLPLDFDLWLRDDVMHVVDKASCFLDPNDVDEMLDSPHYLAEMEERQKLVKARAFLRAASFYGDPADSEGNEAVIQVSEYAEVERHLKESASTIGTVGAEELEFQHLSLRALVDTLRTGGYVDDIQGYLQRYFPLSSSTTYSFLSPTSGESSSSSSSSASSSSDEDTTSVSSSGTVGSTSSSMMFSPMNRKEVKEVGGGGESGRDATSSRSLGGGTTAKTSFSSSAPISSAMPSKLNSARQPPPSDSLSQRDLSKGKSSSASLSASPSPPPLPKQPTHPPLQGGKRKNNKKKKKKKEKDQDVDYNMADACGTGIVNNAVENLRHVVYRLYRMIQLRNSSTVNEDVHRYKVLHEAVNKEQSATADVQALNREYEEVKASRKREVAVLDEEIIKLEEELRYVQRAADVELEAFHEVSAKMEKDHRQGYQEQLEVHRQAAEAVKEKMKRAQLEHTEKANQLRSLRAKKEAAVSGAIVEYETQMATMTGAMKKLQKEYEEETAKVLELEDQLVLLQKEKKEYEVEQMVKERREKHHHEVRGELEHNARVLQAYFRAYLARVKFEKEVAAKSKKKKKGKKKK